MNTKENVKLNNKGSITLFVLFSGLFLIMFLSTMLMLSAIKRQAGIDATKQAEEIYGKKDEQEIYDSYFGTGEIPIYTKEQLFKIGSGENVQINEEGGKIYTFSKNSTYALKNDISFEYNGIWNLPALEGNGVLDGQNNQIAILDTSKKEAVYYYYNNTNNYKWPVTKEGYSYANLMLQYDGINNTGNGNSTVATIWKDLSGNGNNGTMTGFSGSYWEDKKLRLDGVDDYINTNVTQASLGNKITITAICKAEDINNYRGLFGLHYVDSKSYWGIVCQFDNETLKVGMAMSHATIDAKQFKDKELSITCVMESNKPNKLYIGDTLVAAPERYMPFIPNGNLIIGKSFDTADRYWLGTISNFMVYNELLTEEEIAQNYKIDKARFNIE